MSEDPRRTRSPSCRRLTAPLAALLATLAAPAFAQSADWRPALAKDRSALMDAIPLGVEEKLTLYACRAAAGPGMEIGRYRSDFDGCHIAFAGREISVSHFELLTAPWLDGRDGAVPAGALIAGSRVVPAGPGGFTSAVLSPCRASYAGGVHVGEISQGDAGCAFGYGGRTVTARQYQVLAEAPWMDWVLGTPKLLPSDAIVGGHEGGTPMMICRAGDATGLHIGKIRADATGCSIAVDGQEVVSSRFSLLVPRWERGESGVIPISALPAGAERQTLLYLCRAEIGNTVQLGKIAESLSSCHVGMQGGEVSSVGYQVLSVR